MITWDTVGGLAGTAAVFILGLLAPALRTWFEEDVLGARRERRRGVTTRAVTATEECLAALLTLRAAIVDYVKAEAQVDAAAKKAARDARDSLLARIEAHIPLAPRPVQPSLQALLPLLQYAHRLHDTERNGPDYHPDSVGTIVGNVIAHMRQVLTAGLNGGKLPAPPEEIVEYQYALVDFRKDMEAEFANESAQYEGELKVFRTAHGLSPKRESQ